MSYPCPHCIAHYLFKDIHSLIFHIAAYHAEGSVNQRLNKAIKEVKSIEAM